MDKLDFSTKDLAKLIKKFNTYKSMISANTAYVNVYNDMLAKSKARIDVLQSDIIKLNTANDALCVEVQGMYNEMKAKVDHAKQYAISSLDEADRLITEVKASHELVADCETVRNDLININENINATKTTLADAIAIPI